MKDGDPTNNRIDDVINSAPAELSLDSLKNLLLEPNISLGAREFFELVGLAFFRAPIPHTAVTFRDFVYKFVNIQREKLKNGLLKDNPEKNESYEDYIRRRCMEISMEALGDVDFETIVYLATMLQNNDWGDFERILSQKNPIPQNPETSQTTDEDRGVNLDQDMDKTQELSIVAVNTDTSSGEAANSQEGVRQKNDWLITSSSLENIFRSQGITEARQLLILSVLFECQQESMKAEVSVNKLNAAVSEKVAVIRREINKWMSDLKLSDKDMNPKTLRNIIKRVFLKHLPTKYSNETEYKILRQLLLTGNLDLDTTFTKIRAYLIEADYMKDAQQASTEVLFPNLRSRDEQ